MTTGLNTVLILAFALDPAIVLAVWLLACLGALGIGLLVARLVQGPADPFARLDRRPAQMTNLFDTDDHAPQHALRDRAAWKPMHTGAAVARRGRHHTGDRRLVASLLDTQAITPAAELLAAVRDHAERAA